MFIKRSIKVFIIAIAAFAFASVGTAFAAANTVDASKAGDGNAAISGYDVSSIHYNLASPPSTLHRWLSRSTLHRSLAARSRSSWSLQVPHGTLAPMSARQ
jgi:hypothetical protein